VPGTPIARRAGDVSDLSTRLPSRLNWGCGPYPAPGWLNADLRAADGVQLVCDIRDGLPLADATVTCAVAMHVLQDLAWGDVPRALGELHRVLAPGAPLRIGVPDLDRAIDAYRRNDGAYFHVPDADARDCGAKLVTQIIWYGSVRTPFTFGYAREVLEAAGFRDVRRCAYGETTTGDAAIVALDNRPRETLFIEARR
jgi:SAM-dependent methyltransferase